MESLAPPGARPAPTGHSRAPSGVTGRPRLSAPYVTDRLPFVIVVIRSAFRGPHPVPWPRVALYVVLIALIHVLGCSHGPAVGAVAVRADTPLPASVTAVATPAVEAPHATAPEAARPDAPRSVECADDELSEGPRCTGLPEPGPTAMTPRSDLAVSTPGTTRAGPPGAGDTVPFPIHRSPSVLSVWRT